VNDLTLLTGMTFILLIVNRLNWLTKSGTFAAGIMGGMVIIFSDWQHIIPFLIFFIAGSITSKLQQPSSGSGRNAIQVISNGIIALIMLLIFSLTQSEIYLTGFLVSLSISLCDTFSSDVGSFMKGSTYDIITWKPVQSGVSGGVSLPGTIAGLVASVLFALFAGFIYDINTNDLFAIVAGGVAGMITDSILGSRWQSRYLLHGKIIEEKMLNAVHHSGHQWLDNNMVNLVSNLSVSLLSLMFVKIISGS
jgi:uncharacterized protein (TIGR00297 family)